MSRELILHIGTTKTGSTSIQYVLDAKAQELPSQGAYWPATHDAKRHLLMALSHSSIKRFHEMVGNPLWQGMTPSSRIAAYGDEFSREMSALPASIDRVIMSAEQFSEMLRTKTDIERLHATLSPHFSKMTVVIYLRRQDSHYSSMYAQMLRMGNLQQPDLASVKIGFNHDYNYARLLRRWASVFGRRNMMPRLFERTGSKKFDVVEDFLDVCRVTLNLSPDDQARSRNPSMNAVGQQVLLRVGEIYERKTGLQIGGGVLWAKVAEAVTQVAPGHGWLPTRQEARLFLDRFAESNEVVRAQYFSDRATLFDEDLSRLPEAEAGNDPAVAFETACAALLENVSISLRREQAQLLQIAKSAEANGDTVRMKQALIQVIGIDPHNIPARIALARHHIAQGDHARARGIFKVVAGLAPEDPAVRRLERDLVGVEGTLVS